MDNSNTPVDSTVPVVPAVDPSTLTATNSGVDLTASNLGGDNPQVAQAVKDNPNLTVADQAVLAADPTPAQEAALSAPTLSTMPVTVGVDGSGITQTTNQDVIDNFPKNANGQVEIDSNGQVVGLSPENQPTVPTSPAPATPSTVDSDEVKTERDEDQVETDENEKVVGL